MRKFAIIAVYAIVEFLFSLGCVAVGWNVLLVKVFPSIQTLSFGQLCLLTLALPFIAVPITFGIKAAINNKD